MERLNIRSGAQPVQRKIPAQGDSMTEAYYNTLPFAPDVAAAARLPAGFQKTADEHASLGYLNGAVTVDGIATARRNLTVYSEARRVGG